jgi:hypothetical protein
VFSPYESGLTLGEILHQVGEVEEERGERREITSLLLCVETEREGYG